MAKTSPKKNSIKEIVIEFAQNTTIHSISKQVNPDVTNFRKIIWLAFLLGSLCYLIYQVKCLALLYISRPVSIRNDWTTNRKLEFPAVTICNLNPLRKSKIVESKFWNVISDENSSIWASGNQEQEMHIKRLLNTFINALNDTQRKDFGHQLEDLIVKCSWKGNDCSTWFYPFFSPKYGNCYTFQAKKNSDTLYATSTGDEEPLSLILNVEGHEYVGAVSSYLGVILEIHHPDILPFPSQEGMKMAPGFSTNIGISKKVFERLGDPFTLCRDENEIIHKNKLYSVNGCLKLCEANVSFETCGCIKPIYNINPPCDPFNMTQRECIKKMEEFTLETALRECKCFQPCRDVVYHYSSSFSVWPSTESWKYLKQDLENKTKAELVSTLHKTRDNFLNVHIFYKTFNVQTTVEVEGYKFENLVGDIGGQLGLFVGMSVLSLAEVFELVIDVIAKVIKRNQANVESTQAESIHEAQS